MAEETVDLDGQEAGRFQMDGGNKYSDKTISLAAGTRPKVSRLVLCFDPNGNGQFDFKLDRVHVRAR